MRAIVLKIILLAFTIGLNAQNTINSSEYNLENVKDCTPAVLKMMKDAKETGVSKITFAPGVYHFYPDKAFEKFCFIANHDDGLRRTPFPVIGFNNLTIDAQNAMFVFHGLMVPFIIEESENINLSGFSIDWELPLASEALVVANNDSANTFDIKIPEDQPYEIRNSELYFLKEGYEHNLDRSIYWDPATGAVAHNTQNYGPFSTRRNSSVVRFANELDYPYTQDSWLPVNYYRGKSNSVFAEEISPGIVRIRFSGRRNVPPVGLVLVAKGLNGYNRLAPAIRIKSAKKVNLTNVSIFSAGGMGIIAESSSDIMLDSVTVKPSPGKGRMLSTSADATHFVNCRGKVTLRNSFFSNQLDDATNVHGIYLQVTDILASNKIGVTVGHFQQLGFNFAEPGDQIAFVNANKSYDPALSATLKKIKQINGRYFIAEFEKDVTLNPDLTYIIENLSAYPELEITGCKIMNNRARGVLLSTPKKILVEDNYFSTMMSAILIEAKLNFWYESGAVQNLNIKNNTFSDCAYGGGQYAVIRIHTDIKNQCFPFRNINIENNVFNTFDSAILSAENVDGLTFQKNTVLKSGTYKPLFPNNAVISVSHSKDVELINNTLNSGFESTFKIDKFTRNHIVIEENEIKDE